MDGPLQGSIPRPPWPFIVGCSRSGTTLLRAILDSHPDLAVPPECLFIPGFARSQGGRPIRSRRFLKELYGHDHFPRWGVDRRDLRDRLAALGRPSLPDAIRAVYASLRDS